MTSKPAQDIGKERKRVLFKSSLQDFLVDVAFHSLGCNPRL